MKRIEKEEVIPLDSFDESKGKRSAEQRVDALIMINAADHFGK